MNADPTSLLPAGRSRETKIRRDRLGRWFNEDVPISHPSVSKAFDSWLMRAEDGRFCLSNAINWAYVDIEGPAFVVQRVEVGEGVLLCLSNGAEEHLDADTLVQADDGALYCYVRSGGQGFPMLARFDQHALRQLADYVDEDAEGPLFRFGGRVIRPKSVAEPRNDMPRPHGAPS